MRIERILDPARLGELEPDWLDLMDRSDAKDFFLLPQWFRAWWNVFGADGDLRAYAVWDEKLVGLAVLRLTRRGPFRVLLFAGLPSHSDRANFLLARGREKEATRLILDSLLRDGGFDAIRLDNFSPFSSAAEALAETLADLGQPHVRQACQSCQYAPLTEYADFDDYLRKMSLRRRVRNKANRLNALGGRVKWDMLEELAPVLDEMEDLDQRRSMRAELGLNFFRTPENKRFLANLDRELAGTGMIKLFALRLDGVLVAYVMHFDHDNRLMAYQPAYDKQFANMSLGSLCFARSVEYAFAQGRSEYDFLLGGESYKTLWTRHSHENTRFIVYGSRPGASLLRAHDSVIKPLRRRLKDTPAGRWLVRRRAGAEAEAQ